MMRGREVAERPIIVFPTAYDVRRRAVEMEVVARGYGAVSRIAKAVGRSRQYVSAVIHGKRWSPETLARLEALLFTSAHE